MAIQLMDNRFNRVVTKARLADLISTSLNESVPSDAPTSSVSPVFNIKQMIDGKYNFKIIYGLMYNSGMLNTSTSTSTNNVFRYNNQSSAIYVRTGSDGKLKSNVVYSTSIMGGLPTASSTSPNILVPMYGYSTLKETDDSIYYFIPASTSSSTTGYLGIGALSNCWNHPTSLSPKWVIGDRFTVYKNRHYIIQLHPNAYDDVKYYMYNYDGSYNSAGYINLTHTLADRLTGNFFDIINGMTQYQSTFWGTTTGSILHSSWAYTPAGTLPGTMFHVASRKQISGKAFGEYGAISLIDLNTMGSRVGSTSNGYLMLYPALPINSNNAPSGTSWATSTQNTAGFGPVSDTYGTHVFVMPASSWATGMHVLCNAPTSYSSGYAWQLLVNTNPDSRGVEKFPLIGGYNYIFVASGNSPVNTQLTIYVYNAYGNLLEVNQIHGGLPV